MRKSKLLAKIRAGQVARVCSTGSPLAYFPAAAAHFGYDAVWVDTEHRAWDPREVRETILRHHHADIDCIFRPHLTERAALSRCLEDGATALMIPMVNTPERARQLAEFTKFPPLGDRGLDGTALDAGFGVGRTPEYTNEANRETALIVQIETPQAVENAEAIAAVDGVDLLFVGPGDLSLRLGCAASVRDAALRAAIERVATASLRTGKPWGMPVSSIADARTVIDMGGRFVSFGGEYGGVIKMLESHSGEWNEMIRSV